MRRTYRTSGIDALTSPITFLYEQFNRLERSKSAKWPASKTKTRRRALLRELLLGKYVDYRHRRPARSTSSPPFSISSTRVKRCSRRSTQYEFILWTQRAVHGLQIHSLSGSRAWTLSTSGTTDSHLPSVHSR